MRQWPWLWTLSVAACSVVTSTEDLANQPADASNEAPSADSATPDSSSPSDSGTGGTDGFVELDATNDAGQPCSADLATDKLHCGKCFHDCSGGTCVGGLCRMTAANTVYGGEGLTLTGNDVAFTALDLFTSGVYTCAKTGCQGAGPKTLLLNTADSGFPNANPDAIAAYGSNVYWASYEFQGQGGVYRTPLDAGATLRVSTGDSFSSTGAVAVSDAGIFWASDDINERLAFCPIGGCAGKASLLPAVNGGNGWGVLLPGDGSVVWVENAKIARCASPACPGGPSVADAAASGPLATDGTTLYFAASFVHEIRSCPLTNCASSITTIIGNVTPYVGSLALHGGHLYWTIAGTDPGDGGLTTDGRVQRCDRANCATTATDIATNQAAPRAIAVDDDSVYWINGGLVQQFNHPSMLMKAPLF